MRGTWFWRPLALLAALVLFSACANPFVGQAKSPVLTAPSANPSPTPLAAATPTGPLTASAPSLKVGEVNAVYPQLAFSATGGRPPYQWTVYAGAPPPGMSLGTDGSLNGSPTAAGTFKFVAQVADSGTSTATAPGQIVIKPALVASLLPPCATACAVEIPCADVCGLFGTVNGGVAPYTYSVTSGTVPSGTALANNAFRLTGFFRGGPGFLQFTASVKDGLGQTFDLSPAYQIYPHISLTGGTCDYPNILPSNPQPPIPSGATCQQQVTYSGGLPGAVTMKVDGWSGRCSNGAPCPEPPISATGSNGTLTITVGSLANYPGRDPSGTYTIHILDSGFCIAGAHCASNTVQFVLSWDG